MTALASGLFFLVGKCGSPHFGSALCDLLQLLPYIGNRQHLGTYVSKTVARSHQCTHYQLSTWRHVFVFF